MKTTFMMCLVLMALAGCSAGGFLTPTFTPTPTPCNVQAADYIKLAEATMTEWDDAVTLASNTSRIALSGPISDLQSIKRKIESATVPECAKKVQILQVKSMESVIKAFFSFMADDSPNMQESLFNKAKADQDYWIAEFVNLKLGSGPAGP